MTPTPEQLETLATRLRLDAGKVRYFFKPENPRWTYRRKRAFVEAIKLKILTDEDAGERYGVSADELAHWRALLKGGGELALRTTRAQVAMNRIKSLVA